MRSAKQKFLTLLVGLLFVPPSSGIAQAQAQNGKELPERGAITGRVLNDSGQPLSNITVVLRTNNVPTPARTSTTDSEGRFRVEDLGRALYYVSAIAPSYFTPLSNPEEAPAQVQIGDDVTLTLIKGGVITGKITNVMGQPVVQVPVRAFMIRDAKGQTRGYRVFQTPERSSDDRGIYRLYGLLPGIYVVSAGSRGAFSGLVSAYDTDAPTYAPSSSRDNATEITVGAGEEIDGVDIAYRGEPGRSITGTVMGLPANTSFTVSLTRVANELPQLQLTLFQASANTVFTFAGLAEGEYEITAQGSLTPRDRAVSELRRITVKHADVVGIELSLRPLGSISGQVTLEPSSETDCQGKRRPVFSETVISAQPIDDKTEKNELRRPFVSAQSTPDQEGKFNLRSLRPELYRINTRFVAKYWYVKAISVGAPSNAVSTGRPVDGARAGIMLKSGQQASGLMIKLAEGAASIRGRVTMVNDDGLAANSSVILVPAEKEHREDVLRYFTTRLAEDGSFAMGNVPPGHYLALVHTAIEAARLRDPDQNANRVQLRLDAAAANHSFELKPCQNIVDYELRLKSAPPRN